MKDRYDDIIRLPHHVSVRHPHMPIADRAAQFMPFKALSGYEDDITEETRLTQQRIELTEGEQELLDQQLQLLGERLAEERPEVRVICFVPDVRKDGGAYQTLRGRVKKLDPVEGVMLLDDGRRVRFADIYSIEG